jgi:hypothetical protein
MFFARPLHLFAYPDSDSQGKLEKSTKKQTYDRGPRNGTTPLLRWFLQKLKLLQSMDKIFGVIRSCFKC